MSHSDVTYLQWHADESGQIKKGFSGVKVQPALGHVLLHTRVLCCKCYKRPPHLRWCAWSIAMPGYFRHVCVVKDVLRILWLVGVVVVRPYPGSETGGLDCRCQLVCEHGLRRRIL